MLTLYQSFAINCTRMTEPKLRQVTKMHVTKYFWKNLYLSMRNLFNPKNRAKAERYEKSFDNG